jgi:DNA-binding NtrC family response regulator
MLIEELQKYSWPGNVRQLKRVCEHLALMAPLPIVRDVDVRNLLHNQQSVALSDKVNFDRGLAALMQDYEKALLEQALEMDLDVDDLARKLQISRSSLYKKVKDHQLEIKK